MESQPRSHEVAALRKMLHARTRTTAVFVLIFIGVSGLLVFKAVTDPDARQHVLGGSEQVTATVVGERSEGWCRRRGPRISDVVEWTSDGERHSSSTVARCSDPYDEGDDATMWRTDGATFTESPTRRRLLVAGALLVAIGSAVSAARGGDRLHRTVNGVLSGEPLAGPFPTTVDRHTRSLHVQLGPAASTSTYEIPKRAGTVVIETPGRVRRSARTPRGNLWASHLRDGQPRGLTLFVDDDGSRVWRLLG